ncbi:hypothetical protein JXB02_05845 [Candidatus Woesearchaeota archaeon]|nr:hypothetical protein [Candidatus Woesearchaeota archaeon]
MPFDLAYLFWEHIVEVLAGIALFTVIFLFLPQDFRGLRNYLLLILLPGWISTAFPDLAYAGSYLLRYGALSAIMQPHKPLGTYDLFHSPASYIAVPLMIGLVYLTVLVMRRMGKETELPAGWMPLVGAISLLGVTVHLAFDLIGL